ncbi:peptidase M23 [Actibacterium lipolyticum]|uniref:Peptidase M23 n=1 Tax=Actibacterium lipolyticum TaxID=1524263 RepID=A0A238JWL2_9RHOB|nr:peptidase M23 [Actibacterium lipolyticum]SMX34587.1 hypothetical protein COL8621_01384 [Actibacterium lipolyticum]
MTRLPAVIAATLLASPALAHGGPHLHPHGAEISVAALFAISLGLYLAFKIAKR